MSQDTHEYINADGETRGAFAGTEQDKVYASDPDWTPVGKSTPATETPAGSKSTGSPDDYGTDGKQTSDLDSLSRDELNALAAEKGIEEPEDLPNKAAVKDAIKATETPAGDDEDGQ
jgi:hypothetical protein